MYFFLKYNYIYLIKLTLNCEKFLYFFFLTRDYLFRGCFVQATSLWLSAPVGPDAQKYEF